MKHIKNILIILLALVASAAFLAFMWNAEWKPLSEMTELGYQEVTPVAKATKPVTYSDGTESTDYYVVLEVDTVDGPRRVGVLMSEAYGKKDLLQNLENYRKKKKVEGYYFYSEATGQVYFSKELATAQEYMEQKAKPYVEMVLLVDVFLVIILACTSGFSAVCLPEIPGGAWSEKDFVVCRYSTGWFGFVLVICVATGVMCLWAAFHLTLGAISKDSLDLEGYTAGSLFFLLGIIFFGMAVVFLLYMKNYVVIFYPQGIVYRNILGKTWNYSDEQVKYVSIIDAYKNRSLRVQTEEKNIWLNSYCTNYYKAKEAVMKYPGR